MELYRQIDDTGKVVLIKKYDLTIDNNGFLRYKGEINIVLKDLEKDERVNVIGHLNTTDFIISKVKEGRKFTFVNKYE